MHGAANWDAGEADTADNSEGTSESPDVYAKPKTAIQSQNEELVKELVSTSEFGLFCDTSEAIASLMIKDRRKKKPFPWKVALEIGPNIAINTVGYIQVGT